MDLDRLMDQLADRVGQKREEKSPEAIRSESLRRGLDNMLCELKKTKAEPPK